MKIFTKTTRERIQNVLWLLGGFVCAVAILATSPLPLGIVTITVLIVIALYGRQIALAKVLWRERRLIRDQPNSHQRGYIFQRLEMLLRTEDRFSTQDPHGDKTFTVGRHSDKHLGVIYDIDFVENECLGAAAIGNKYRHTTHSYQLSPKWATVHHKKAVTFLLSDKSEYQESKVTQDKLDHLPDDVVARIEYALINWQPRRLGS